MQKVILFYFFINLVEKYEVHTVSAFDREICNELVLKLIKKL